MSEINNSRKLSTGFVSHELYFWHNNIVAMGSEKAGVDPKFKMFNQQWGHFESPESKRRILNLIEACGLIDEMKRIRPIKAKKCDLLRFHVEAYVDRIKKESNEKMGGDGGDYAPFGKGSYYIAKLAVGGCIEAVKSVLNKEIDNAYVLCRPPGHHAESNQGRGFCLFNNVVLTAEFAREKFGLERIFILDWDVHHGNGTEKAFYESGNVLFMSIHQDNLYPLNSGGVERVGVGAGQHLNINVPVPPGAGIGMYEAIFERVVEPALRAFRPQLVLVSCGFDACALDPLSHVMLNATQFGRMTTRLVEWCSASPDRHGPVLVHEGGYSEVYAPFCALRVCEALLGVPQHSSTVSDDYDEEIAAYGYQSLQPHQDQLIAHIEQHALNGLLTRMQKENAL